MSSIHDVINKYESNVRSYVRVFPAVFNKAKGSRLLDEDGVEYIDFFSGAGALNYGHNEDSQIQALVSHISTDGIVHSLDMATNAKVNFIQGFEDIILEPRSLSYKIQFTGPTGANAIEAALKLARLNTGRSNVIAFTHSFHGVSLGALSATANESFRNASGIPLNDVAFLPYEGYVKDLDSISYIEKLLNDPSSGLDKPAAIIVETIQGEGGVNVASANWLKDLRSLATKHSILLIIDDIQAGCGRSGDFFSFEFADIHPDLIVLSKSISGIGLPMSLLLIKPELDIWSPGQHNGTFRGNNLAFITALQALETYWRSDHLSHEIKSKELIVRKRLETLLREYPNIFVDVRGRGLFYGIELQSSETASQIRQLCFENNLIIETSGANNEVIKFMPALNIDTETLHEGIEKFENAIARYAERGL